MVDDLGVALMGFRRNPLSHRGKPGGSQSRRTTRLGSTCSPVSSDRNSRRSSLSASLRVPRMVTFAIRRLPVAASVPSVAQLIGAGRAFADRTCPTRRHGFFSFHAGEHLGNGLRGRPLRTNPLETTGRGCRVPLRRVCSRPPGSLRPRAQLPVRPKFVDQHVNRHFERWRRRVGLDATPARPATSLMASTNWPFPDRPLLAPQAGAGFPG